MDSRQRRANHPSVIGRVDAARHERLSGSQEKPAQSSLGLRQRGAVRTAQDGQRCGERLDHESGIGRRRQISCVERAIGVLRVDENARRSP